MHQSNERTAMSNMEQPSAPSNSRRASNIDSQPPPPSYPNAVYKIEDLLAQGYYENDFEMGPPPRYPGHDPETTGNSVTYLNNYPEPPITNGNTQQFGTFNVPSDRGQTTRNLVSKKMRIFLAISGIITILLGLTAISLQIALLAANAFVYYYYGFWAGALIVGVGVSTVVLSGRNGIFNLQKLFSSFLWQIIFIAVVFAFAIMIVATDVCNNYPSQDDPTDNSCKRSSKVLNAILLTTFALAFVQSIINCIAIGILKRRIAVNSHILS